MKRIMVFGMVLALVLGVFSGCGKAPEEPIATAEPVQETEPQVTTMDEFLAAIGPDRTVTLAAGTYNLSDAADYGRSGGSAWYRWEKTGDGYQRGQPDHPGRGDGGNRPAGRPPVRPCSGAGKMLPGDL